MQALTDILDSRRVRRNEFPAMLVKIFLFSILCVGQMLSQTSESQNQPTPPPQKTPTKPKPAPGPINPRDPGGAQAKPAAGSINPSDPGGAQARPGSTGGVSESNTGATSGASAGGASNSSTSGSVSGNTQNASASASSGGARGTIVAGTEIRVTLSTPLSSKTSHRGDRFVATLEEPLRGINGDLAPGGSHVEGEITAAEGENADSSKKRGRLNLRFNYLVLPSGGVFSLAANLVAINSQGGLVANNDTSENKVQTANVRVGSAAAEAVPTARNGIGAGVGSATSRSPVAKDSYIVATQGKEVELPAGTVMVLRLQQPLELR